MSSLNEIVEFVKDDLVIVKKNIQELSKKESEYSEEISKRLSHVLSSPGKQLRPVITLICSKLFGKINKENSLRMATAVELLHIATLIHDDTVDKADIRRGKATASNLWGNNIAVLLGDYVFATSAIFVCDTGNIILVKRFAETIVELSKGELFENIETVGKAKGELIEGLPLEGCAIRKCFQQLGSTQVHFGAVHCFCDFFIDARLEAFP